MSDGGNSIIISFIIKLFIYFILFLQEPQNITIEIFFISAYTSGH